MKLFLNLLGKFYLNTAMAFLPLALLFTSVGNRVVINSKVFVTMCILLLFSSLLSVIFIICDLMKINIVLKRVIHFILTYGAFLLSFFVLPQKLSDMYTVVMMTLVFVLAYAVLGGAKIGVCAFLSSKGEQKDYENVYDGIKK